MTDDERAMGLFEHIKELRERLFRAIIAVILAMIVASIFADSIIAWVVRPLEGSSIIVLSPTEAPVIYFKMAMAIGFVIALPYILYQIYGFVKPGLYPNERKVVLIGIPAIFGFFLLGSVFTLQMLIPLSLPILMGFLGEVVQPTYSLEAYLSFVTTLITWMGLLFQTPLLVFVIARIGLVSPKQLSAARRGVWFGAAVFAAVVTPTHDPITMLLATGPFLMLYEVGIILARVAAKQRRTAQSEDA
jgi:sec-independent protein translocase protein TatC